MSKERARRREAREHEQALLAAARAAEAERRERRTARRRAVASWLPERSRTGRPTGVLAERERRQRTTTVVLVVALKGANDMLKAKIFSWLPERRQK